MYFEYNQFRGEDIVLKDYDRRDGFFKRKNAINDIVLKVLNCKNKSAFELVEMTHKEDPWKNTRQNEVIKLDIISEYFSNNNPLKIKEEA